MSRRRRKPPPDTWYHRNYDRTHTIGAIIFFLGWFVAPLTWGIYRMIVIHLFGWD